MARIDRWGRDDSAPNQETGIPNDQLPEFSARSPHSIYLPGSLFDEGSWELLGVYLHIIQDKGTTPDVFAFRPYLNEISVVSFRFSTREVVRRASLSQTHDAPRV
jgi:hypothetical protein